jgi:hypothetical protein
MAKRMLIVTDLRVESLNTLRLALEHAGEEPVEIVLMYAEASPDSITEMLFHNPEHRIKELVKPDFREALAILKNRYENVIRSLRIRLFSGFSTNAFRNFADGLRMEVVYLPRTYQLQPGERGFDPAPYIKKSGLPYHELDYVPGADSVSDRAFESHFKLDTI